ncbi:FecR family protein [Puteibacter caeruleilacunae]|nr:FecR family protein [Puteibacter caeruleilacunae]
MNDNTTYYNELTAKYLSGRCDGAEMEELANFVNSTPENKRWFNKQKQNWQPQRGEDLFLDYNWDKLSGKLSAQKSTNIVQLPRRKFIWSSIAAILIIGLVISNVYQYISNGSEEQEAWVFETPRGQKSKVTLPDGSEVWLNAETKLVAASFTAQQRVVELEGEAFFKVHHNKKAPFRVKTVDYDVEVLGTEFNVMAYDDFERTETALVNGSVKIIRGTQEMLMKPGEKVVYNNNKFIVGTFHKGTETGWVNDQFNFENVSFYELVRRLERWYDVDIQYNLEEFADTKFSGVFKNEETIWQVLDGLKLYLPITYKRTNMRKIDVERVKE